MSFFTPIAIVVLVIFFLSAALRILNEYERGVIFRLGRVIAAKGPGLIILIPIVDKMIKVSLRLVAMDVDPQDVITRITSYNVCYTKLLRMIMCMKPKMTCRQPILAAAIMIAR